MWTKCTRVGNALPIKTNGSCHPALTSLLLGRLRAYTLVSTQRPDRYKGHEGENRPMSDRGFVSIDELMNAIRQGFLTGSPSVPPRLETSPYMHPSKSVCLTIISLRN